MSNHVLFYQVALFYLTANFLSYSSGQYTTYYVDEHPTQDKESINLRYTSYDSSIILIASTKSYPGPGKYSLTVESPGGMDIFRIQGTVQQFQLRDKDRLIITRTNGVHNCTIYDNQFNKTTLKAFRTEVHYNKALIFDLKLGLSNQKFEGFEITLTAARFCFGSVDRQPDEHYCSNSYCIKDNWRCNDRDNCGNGSDEKWTLCNNITEGSIIGLSIGAVLLVGLVAGCVIIICRRKNKRPTTLTTRTVTEPPQSNIYPGSQTPVPNPLPPGTYLYNTNTASWEQFPDHTTPPPPYSGLVNQTFSPPYPSNQQRY